MVGKRDDGMETMEEGNWFVFSNDGLLHETIPHQYYTVSMFSKDDGYLPLRLRLLLLILLTGGWRGRRRRRRRWGDQ
jgi:hypothetical protein